MSDIEMGVSKVASTADSNISKGPVPDNQGFDTRMCDCCAVPGGCDLCVQTCFCPFITLAEINETAGGENGWLGGFLAGIMSPFSSCWLLMQHGRKIEKEGRNRKRDVCLKAMFCNCCYQMQVRRQQMINDPMIKETPNKDGASPGFAKENGLCDCCASPGGPGLCLQTIACPFITLAQVNEAADGPYGWMGGFLAGFTNPVTSCMMLMNHGRQMEKDGYQRKRDVCWKAMAASAAT